MNVVMISTNLHKLNLVPLGYLKANIFKVCINIFGKNHSSVFCRAYQMIKQYGNIMSFMNIFAHSANIS